VTGEGVRVGVGVSVGFGVDVAVVVGVSVGVEVRTAVGDKSDNLQPISSGSEPAAAAAKYKNCRRVIFGNSFGK
jgi:hypothetical protein